MGYGMLARKLLPASLGGGESLEDGAIKVIRRSATASMAITPIALYGVLKDELVKHSDFLRRTPHLDQPVDNLSATGECQQSILAAFVGTTNITSSPTSSPPPLPQQLASQQRVLKSRKG